MSAFLQRLSAGSSAMGLALTPAQLDRMEAYWQAVLRGNEVMNLTAVVDDVEAADRHFLDSLAPLALPQALSYLPPGALAVDVGTGAGFPGVPLLIARPDLRVTFLDSLQKRTRFVAEALASIGIRANVVHARAEDFARDPRNRAAFDAVLSRAVAGLPTLLELCLPLLATGGHALLYKGPEAASELARAEKALQALGGQALSPLPYSVPGRDWSHLLLPFRQIRPCPAAFPRKAGIPEKMPIGV